MVRVQHDRQFRPDTNATFGEDGAKAAMSFVPKLGRLGRLGYAIQQDVDPKTGKTYCYDTGTLEVVPCPDLASADTKAPTTVLLLAGAGLLGIGLIAYLVARSAAQSAGEGAHA